MERFPLVEVQLYKQHSSLKMSGREYHVVARNFYINLWFWDANKPITCCRNMISKEELAENFDENVSEATGKALLDA